jgi:hypothetical protein
MFWAAEVEGADWVGCGSSERSAADGGHGAEW